MLLVIGFNVILKINYILAISVIILMSLVYYRTIRKEEKMLSDKFRGDYLDYKSKVPAMVPTIFPYRKGEKWPFSFKRLIKSQEYKLFLWMAVLIIVFHLKDEIMVEKEPMDSKKWLLIISAFGLGAIDLLGEFIKHRRRSSNNMIII